MRAIRDALSGHREELAHAWLGMLMSAYPAEAQGFFQNSADPFRNPVGATIGGALGALTDGFLGGAEPASLRGPIEDIVRIRAVQGLGATAALRFVFEFKQVLRSTLAESGGPEVAASDWLAVEAWVDSVGLLAFELYAAARERMWEIRNRDVTARAYSLLKRAGAVEDDGDESGRPPVGRRSVHLKGGGEE